MCKGLEFTLFHRSASTTATAATTRKIWDSTNEQLFLITSFPQDQLWTKLLTKKLSIQSPAVAPLSDSQTFIIRDPQTDTTPITTQTSNRSNSYERSRRWFQSPNDILSLWFFKPKFLVNKFSLLVGDRGSSLNRHLPWVSANPVLRTPGIADRRQMVKQKQLLAREQINC